MKIYKENSMAKIDILKILKKMTVIIPLIIAIIEKLKEKKKAKGE